MSDFQQRISEAWAEFDKPGHISKEDFADVLVSLVMVEVLLKDKRDDPEVAEVIRLGNQIVARYKAQDITS